MVFVWGLGNTVRWHGVVVLEARGSACYNVIIRYMEARLDGGDELALLLLFLPN